MTVRGTAAFVRAGCDDHVHHHGVHSTVRSCAGLHLAPRKDRLVVHLRKVPLGEDHRLQVCVTLTARYRLLARVVVRNSLLLLVVPAHSRVPEHGGHFLARLCLQPDQYGG